MERDPLTACDVGQKENKMTNETNAIEAFRASAKFRCMEPEFAHLNPSPDSVTLQARQILEKCIDDVLEGVRAEKSKNMIKTEISKAINEVEKGELDTEDREYVAFYFHKLGNLTGVNVSFAVNRWLYGWPIALFTLFRKNG